MNTQTTTETKTLRKLIEEHDANAFVLEGAGNGSAGEAILWWDAGTEKKYGDTEMVPISPFLATDGQEVNYGSTWIVVGEGNNPYRYRVFF